jgi:hypothetical protein
MSDDECALQAVNAIDPNWQQSPLLQRCYARQDECSTSPDGFSDDVCIGAIAGTESAKQQLGACLDGECTTIDACIDNLF